MIHPSRSLKPNYHSLTPSITVLGLLVLITAIGAVVIMVRARRIRQRKREDVESPARCFPALCYREDPLYPSSGPHSILRLFRCKGSKHQSEKRNMKGPWIPFTAGGKQNGGLLTPETPVSPSKARLEVSEIAKRSIPKIEHLTGAMVVLAPIGTTINGYSKKPVIHSATTDGGTSRASTSQWSSDISPLHPDLISPLYASPAYVSPTYSNIAALAQKPLRGAVTFTYEEKIAQHISTQFYSTREKQDFSQKKSFIRRLSPLLPPQSVGRHDNPSNLPPVKRRPPPPPPPIIQSGLSKMCGHGPRRTKKCCHRSWNGRSVLELDDSSTSDSENGLLLGVPHYSLPCRKHIPHVPYAQDSYQIFSNNLSLLPSAGTRSVMRFPLQETLQYRNATHPSQAPQFSVAPKVQSLAGDTIYVPVPQRAGPLHLSPPQRGLDSISIASTIYSFEHMHMSEPSIDYRNSVEFSGLSPPPPPQLTSLSPMNISGMIAGAMLRTESEGPRVSFSTASHSVADTVLTEGTVGSTDTLTTEKEIALEMKRIRERAKRASVERKARRADEERQEREEMGRNGKGNGKGKGKEHNS